MSQKSDSKSKIGLKFPLQLEDGRLLACSYEEHIKQSLRTLLSTARGQRIMRPEFGNRLGAYMFENIGDTTASLVKNEIISTIEQSEPRIELSEVKVSGGAHDIGTMQVELTYKIAATGEADRLVLNIGR